jgi:hypothetical protein
MLHRLLELFDSLFLPLEIVRKGHRRTKPHCMRSWLRNTDLSLLAIIAV